MKKFKIGLFIVVLALLFIAGYQNRQFLFLEVHAFQFEIWKAGKWTTPEWPMAYYFIFFLVLGIVLTYIYSLKHRFRARRTEKLLREQISGLEREIDDLKQAAATPLPSASGEQWSGQGAMAPREGVESAQVISPPEGAASEGEAAGMVQEETPREAGEHDGGAEPGKKPVE
ncbi:MAG: hypothetical protein ACLFOY_14320 [Desulfatibacillaceae bacterium]